MGRTPRINTKGGRDHWGNLGPLLLAGGGLPTGQVIGRSNRDGGEPQSEPVTAPPPDRHDHAHAVRRRPAAARPGLPREIGQTMASWDPIPGLSS